MPTYLDVSCDPNIVRRGSPWARKQQRRGRGYTELHMVDMYFSFYHFSFAYCFPF